MKHPTGPPTVTVDKEEWERLRVKLSLAERNVVLAEERSLANALACRDCEKRAAVMREALLFIRAQVHQAHHHHWKAETCTITSCVEARKALGEP